MLTIFWNPNDLHRVDAMPKREKYSRQYYADNILIPIFQRLIPASKCKFVIHAHHSPCHTANVVLDFVLQRKVKFAPYPTDSPDVALSDFFFFGDFKSEPLGSRFQTGKELLVETRN
jgi:hypothetical protein